MAKSLFDDVLKAAQSAQQVAKKNTSNNTLKSNKSNEAAALPPQQKSSTSALETGRTSSGGNATLKNTATKGVQGTSVSNKQSGINPTKVASSIFDPAKQAAGNASRWAALKASRGIAEDNGFGALDANSVRMEDRQKKDNSSVVGNTAIDLAKIVSKNADITFKNTVKAYNANTAAAAGHAANSALSVARKNLPDSAEALSGAGHPSEHFAFNAEKLRPTMQQRNEIDSAIKKGLTNATSPVMSSQAGGSAGAIAKTAMETARLRQAQVGGAAQVLRNADVAPRSVRNAQGLPENLFASAEALRQTMQRRNEIDNTIKGGMTNITAPIASNTVGSVAGSTADSAINAARFRQMQDVLKDLGQAGSSAQVLMKKNGQRAESNDKGALHDALSVIAGFGNSDSNGVGHVNERVDTGEKSALGKLSEIWKESAKQTEREPITVEVEKGGWAPKGLLPGDKVVTSNGTYTIVAVLSDGSYVTDAFGTRNKHGNEIANDKKSLGDYDSDHKFDDPAQKRKETKPSFFDRLEYTEEELQKRYNGLLDDSEEEEKYWNDIDTLFTKTNMEYATDPDAKRFGTSKAGMIGRFYGREGAEEEWTPDQALMLYATEDQKRKLNYVYHKYGYDAAQEYFEALKAKYLNPAFNKDVTTQVNNTTGNAAPELKDYSSRQKRAGTLSEAMFCGDEQFRPEEQDHNYVLSSVGSVAGNAVIPAIAFAGNVMQAGKNVLGIGDYKPVDPNSGLNTFSTAASQLRSNTSQNLQTAAYKNVTDLTGSKAAGTAAKKLTEIAYGAGMSTADMAMQSFLLGGKVPGSKAFNTKFVTASMSTVSANNTLVDSLNRGATQEQAFLNAFVNGGLEYISESPAVEGLGGLLNGQSSVKNVRSAFKAMGRQAGTEALGEAFANVSQTYADDVIMGNKSNYSLTVENYVDQGMSRAEAEKKAFQDLYIKETLTAAATGALAGGMMSGGAIVSNQVQTGRSMQNAARNFAADREGSIDELAEQYESEGMEAEEAREKATEEIDDQIENGAYVNTAASIVLDIAYSTKRADVGQKYKDTANKILNGQKTGVIELANMKGALQEAAQKKAKSQREAIYEYVGLEVPHKLANTLGRYTGHDSTGFANKKFTQAWAQKSAEILEKAQNYEEGDTEANDELEKYMGIADTLFYGQQLSEAGNTTAYARSQVNYILNGIEASAAGANVLSRENSIYEESSQEPDEVSEQQTTEMESLQADENPVDSDTAEPVTLTSGEESSEETAHGENQTASAKPDEAGQSAAEASVETAQPVTVSEEDQTAQANPDEAGQNVETASDKAKTNSTPTGKKQGKTVSYHSSLESANPSQLVEQAKAVSGVQEYDIIRVNENDKTVTFIKADDFDGRTEPRIVSETTVDTQGNVTTESYDNKIIVDKSKYVQPDYEGFDVAAQEEREKTWRNSGIRYDSQSLEDESYFNETFGEVLNPKAENDTIEGDTANDTENTQEEEDGREVRRRTDAEADKNSRPHGGKLGSDGEGRNKTGAGGRQRTSHNVESSESRRGRSQDSERAYAAEAIERKRELRRIGREAETDAEKSIADFVRQFGMGARFYERGSSDMPLGMFDAEENRMYLAIQEDVPFETISGHEIFHHLVKTNSDFAEVVDNLFHLPFEEDRQALKKYCIEHMTAVYKGDANAVAYFDRHWEKALEEVMADDFSNYLVETVFGEEIEFRLRGFQDFENDRIKDAFRNDIEHLLKAHFPGVYKSEEPAAAQETAENVEESVSVAEPETTAESGAELAIPEELKSQGVKFHTDEGEFVLRYWEKGDMRRVYINQKGRKGKHYVDLMTGEYAAARNAEPLETAGEIRDYVMKLVQEGTAAQDTGKADDAAEPEKTPKEKALEKSREIAETAKAKQAENVQEEEDGREALHREGRREDRAHTQENGQGVRRGEARARTQQGNDGRSDGSVEDSGSEEEGSGIQGVLPENDRGADIRRENEYVRRIVENRETDAKTEEEKVVRRLHEQNPLLKDCGLYFFSNSADGSAGFVYKGDIYVGRNREEESTFQVYWHELGHYMIRYKKEEFALCDLVDFIRNDETLMDDVRTTFDEDYHRLDEFADKPRAMAEELVCHGFANAMNDIYRLHDADELVTNFPPHIQLQIRFGTERYLTENGLLQSAEDQKTETDAATQEDTDVSGFDRSLPEGREPEGVSGIQEEGRTEDENQPAERVGGERVEDTVSADEETVHAEQPVREGQEDTDGRGRESGNDRVSGDGTGERGTSRNGSGRRFYLDRTVNPYQQTPARRAEANVEAVKLLKEIQESGRTKLTKEEKQTLAGFTGWGGLGSIIGSGGRYDVQLKQILTKEEYSAAAASSATAYYTPMEIVDTVYEIAKRLGLGQNARILEQFCGNGRFFGYMPQKLRTSSSITGVELDPISGSIAQLLYDDVDIRVQNYNQFDEKGFNLIIGNVPFDTNGVYDENYRAESNNTLHDYGITKGLAQLNPGGIMAVLTSSGTMDKEVKLGKRGDETVVTGGARLMMSERANLIGAIRFPEGTFTGTNVVTDLLIFQKKGEGVDDSLAQDFVRLGTMEVAQDPWSKEKSLPINEYFVSHPEMILGTPYLTKNQFGKEVIGVRKSKDSSKIDSLIEQLPKNIYTKALRERSERLNEDAAKAERGSIEAGEKRSAGVINVIDGEVYTYDKGKWRPYQPMKQPTGKNAANKQPTPDTALLNRIKALYTLEQARDELIEFERRSDDDSAVRSKIAEFEKQYDAFVKKYGAVNSRANEKAYSMSPNYGKLQALENVVEDDDGKTVYEKEAIFHERIAAPPALPKEVNNVSDALRASMNLKHTVDLGYMSELYGKSESEIVEELGEKLFVNPSDGSYVLAEEYLSGNVREKLAEAQEAAKSNPDLLRNVHALMNVLPADLLPEQIDASLGASWIAPEVIRDFANWMFENEQSDVSYNPISSKWTVSNPHNYKVRNRWGTAHMNASELLEHALNNKTPEVKTKENGVNTKATEEAKAKVDEMQQAFRDWVWVDQERSEKLQRIYNDTFNTYVERDVDISHVDRFIGQSDNIKLKPHQIKATLKALYQKATFFVHAVGSGKTFAMIASAQEMKRTGIANKPLMVVPNAKVSDFAKDYRKLYPAANILVVGDKDFSTSTIDRTLAKIEQNDYDCIIMRMSSFDRFPVSAEALEEYKESELGKYRAALEAARTDGAERDSLKEMERSISRYEQKLNQMIADAVNDAYSIEVFLDKCGIDALLLDEAHNYKNLYFPTRQNVAGISRDKVTQKTTHLHILTELMHKRGNRVVLASATPATNSLAEFYSMQRYIQGDLLQEAGIDNFDAWCSVFGSIETKTEMNITGQKYKQKTRFSRLKNIPDLMRMMRQNFDFVSAEDIHLPTPAADIWHIKSPASTLLYHVSALIEQENMLKDSNGKHNVLANYTLANMMALDMRMARKVLIDAGVLSPGTTAEELDFSDSKVNKAVEKVLLKYRESDESKGTQIVFLDRGVPKNAKEPENESDEEKEIRKKYNFDLYADIKTKLIRGGVPAEEIAFIHDFDSDAKKEKLSKKMKSGDIRVLIGSTEKAGTGINVQDKIVALHHIDAPQRPSDMTQRNGRGVRQRNENDKIDIYYYSTMNSYDGAKWEMLNRKLKGIEAVMKGDPNIREVDDSSLDDIFGGLSIAAANNPALFEMQDLKEKIARLEAQRSNLARRKNINDEIVSKYPQRRQALENLLRAYETAKEKTDAYAGDAAKVGRTSYDNLKEASKAAYDAYEKSSMQEKYEKRVIGQVNGVSVIAYQTWESAVKKQFFVSLEGVPWVKEKTVSLLDAKGNKASAKGISPVNMFDALKTDLLENYDEKHEEVSGRLAALEQEYRSASEDRVGEFEGRDELIAARQRYKELEDSMLQAANDSEQSYDLNALLAGDYSGRIATNEELEQQVGYIESGKTEEAEKPEAKEPKEKTNRQKRTEETRSEAKDIQYARKPKTAKERAQETARKASEKQLAKLRSTNVIDESVPHTAEEQKIIDEYKAAVNPELKEFIDSVYSMKDQQRVSKRRRTFGKPKSRESSRLYELTGIDVSEYEHMLDGSTLNHIRKRHGENGKADQSMADPNDIARIKYILDNYDSLDIADEDDFDGRTSKYSNRDGSPAIVVKYTKKIDSVYYVIEIVPDSETHMLMIHTAFAGKNKKKGAQPVHANALPITSETLDAQHPSGNRIPQSEEAAQEKSKTDENRYARKQERSAAENGEAERGTPLRGNLSQQEAKRDYGKTREAKDAIKKSERDAAKDIQSIIKEISKKFKINVFAKHYRKGKDALGFYDPNHQIIHSMDAQQLGTVIHELGHHLDNKHSISFFDGIRDMLRKAPGLYDALERVGYSEREMPGEVFADFIWHYVTLPDAAYEMGSYARGENFYDTFEKTLGKEDLKNLKHIRGMVLSFADMPVIQRSASTIKTREQTKRENRGTFKDMKERALIDFVDFTIPARDLDQTIETVSGRKLSPSERLQLQVEFAGGAASVTHAIMTERLMTPDGQFVEDSKGFWDILKELDKKVSKKNARNRTKVTWREDFDVFLRAMHGIDWERRGKFTMSSDVAGNLAQDEHEANIRAHQQTIEAMQQKYGDLFDEAAEEIYDWWDKFMRIWAVDTGFVNEEEYENWRNLNPHYVPLFRNTDVRNVDRPRSKKSKNSADNPFHYSNEHGSQRDVLSPIENLMVQANNIVTTYFRSQIGATIVKHWDSPDQNIQAAMGTFIAEIDPPQQVQRVHMEDIKDVLKNKTYERNWFKLSAEEKARIESLPEDQYLMEIAKLGDTDIIDAVIDDVVQQFTPRKYGLDEDVIVAAVDGKTRYFQILDPGFAKMISALNPAQHGSFFRFAGKITRAFSAVTTSMNPLFVTMNAVRDFQHGMVMTQGKKWDPLNLTYAASWGRALGEAFLNETGIKRTDLYQQMESANGFVSRYRPSSDTLGQTMKGTMWKLNPLSVARGVLRGINHLNDAAEAAPRYVAYRRAYNSTEGTAQDKHMAGWKAAREATVNFHKKGVKTRDMGMVVPFIGASIAGIKQHQELTASKEAYTTKEGRLRLLRAFVTQSIPAILLSFAYACLADDDDEETAETKKEYDQFSSYLKNSYWMFKVGDTWLRMPKDRELSGMFATMAQYITTAALDPEKRSVDEMAEYLSYMFGLLIPAHELTGKAVLDAKNNNTWYGGTITSSRDENYLTADYYQEVYDAETSDIAVAIAKLIAKMPDGLQNKLGVLATPKAIDYVMDQMGGGVSDVILPLFTPTQRAAGLFSSLKSRHTSNPDRSNRYVSEAYDIYETLKANYTKNHNEDWWEGSEDAAWYDAFTKTISGSNSKNSDIVAMGDYYKEIRAIREDKELSYREREEKINEAYSHIADIAQNLVTAYHNRKSGEEGSGAISATYGEIEMPEGAAAVGFTQESYEKAYHNIKKGDEIESRLALLQSTDLTEEQKTFVSERFAGMKYSNIVKNYSSIASQGGTAEEITAAKKAADGYNSNSAKALAIFSSMGYDAKGKAIVKATTKVSDPETIAKLKSAAAAGVTPEMLDEFKSLCSQLAKPGVKGYGASAKPTATAAANQMEGLTSRQRAQLIALR